MFWFSHFPSALSIFSNVAGSCWLKIRCKQPLCFILHLHTPLCKSGTQRHLCCVEISQLVLMAALSLCHIILSRSVSLFFSVFYLTLSLSIFLFLSLLTPFFRQDVNQRWPRWQHTHKSCCYNKHLITNKEINV